MPPGMARKNATVCIQSRQVGRGEGEGAGIDGIDDMGPPYER